MKRFILLGVVVAAPVVLQLSASVKAPEPIESVEALLADPHRLQDLRSPCRAQREKVGDTQCWVVAQAARRQFTHEHPSRYAADPVRSRVAPVLAQATDTASADTKDE